MAIQILDIDKNSDYKHITVLIGNVELTIMKAPNYINIRYKNAASAVYKGIGKDFANFEEAKANYKKQDIINAIIFAENELDEYKKDITNTIDGLEKVEKVPVKNLPKGFQNYPEHISNKLASKYRCIGSKGNFTLDKKPSDKDIKEIANLISECDGRLKQYQLWFCKPISSWRLCYGYSK